MIRNFKILYIGRIGIANKKAIYRCIGKNYRCNEIEDYKY